MARIFEGIKEAGGPQRRLMDRILQQVLEQNSEFLSVWTCWEPNALDGKDGEFADTPGHDGSGRYVPYWHRQTGGITVCPLSDYTPKGAGDYDLIAKNSGKETFIQARNWSIKPIMHSERWAAVPKKSET